MDRPAISCYRSPSREILSGIVEVQASREGERAGIEDRSELPVMFCDRCLGPGVPVQSAEGARTGSGWPNWRAADGITHTTTRIVPEPNLLPASATGLALLLRFFTKPKACRLMRF